jgi:hypothetical protein
MPFRKLPDAVKKWQEGYQPCRHPEHNPPNMIVLEDGAWEYTCPGCGHRQIVIVNGPTWQVS